MTYFKPRRRKIGAVTLLLACALLVLWTRSRTHSDWILFGQTVVVSGKQRIFVLNQSQALGIVMESTTRGSRTGNQAATLSTRRIETTLEFRYFWGERLGWGSATPNGVITELGIMTGEPKLRRDMFTYWSITVPLILLSACLLLSKQPATKADKDSSPKSPR